MGAAARARPFTALDYIITPTRSAEHTHNFVSCLILTAQNGFGRDVEPFLALSRETWGEEQLWAAIKDLPHGALELKEADGSPMWARDARGAILRRRGREARRAGDRPGGPRRRPGPVPSRWSPAAGR